MDPLPPAPMMDNADEGSHAPGGMVDDAGEGMVETPFDLGNQAPMSELLVDHASPLPTELEMSEVEIVMDSPVHVKECYCHMLECPDRQPESYEDFDVCDYCKAANSYHQNHQNHPVDDVETDVDHYGSGEPMLDKCEGVGDDLDFVDLDVQPPPRKLRRLRPMDLDPMDPLMMEIPGVFETASVDAENKYMSPDGLSLQPDHHEQEESLVCQVSWLM